MLVIRFLLIIVILFMISCGGADKPNNTTSETISNLIKEARTHTSIYDGIPVFFPPDNDQGNAGLFTGLLCFSGEGDKCDQFTRLLDINDRIIRNTWSASNSDKDGASRDELIGHLLYIAKTHDKNHANRLLHGISTLDGKICPNASDTRCMITPGIWGLMKQVWQHIGLNPTVNMIIGNAGDETALLAQAKEAPPNYNSHLIAVNIMLRMHMNTYTGKLKIAVGYLIEKSPSNPFYRFLNNDTQLAADLFIQQASQAQWDKQGEWPWQVDYSQIRFDQTNAWSIVFLGNILINGIR